MKKPTTSTNQREITLRYVHSANTFGTAYTFKTLKGARKKAHTLVGPFPKLDPDGYVFQRVSGNCLFFKGATIEELFPLHGIEAIEKNMAWMQTYLVATIASTTEASAKHNLTKLANSLEAALALVRELNTRTT